MNPVGPADLGPPKMDHLLEDHPRLRHCPEEPWPSDERPLCRQCRCHGQEPLDRRWTRSECECERLKCCCQRVNDECCRRQRKKVAFGEWRWWRRKDVSGTWIMVAGLLLVMVTCGVQAQGMPSEEGVCQSIDIRNSVEMFQKLRGCRVIEGFLQILLIDHANESEYQNLHFPELTEVTGYFLLYRVYGLRTLRHIFPNLAVIRGNRLFFNYAFVVFEVLHMQEIGLPGLTDILRGSVRIEKNPNLCYVDTVDWDLIAKAGKGGHFIKGNKASDECPNICPKECPRAPNSLQPLCWNSHHCQKVCHDSCGNRACSTYSYCCHEQCLGGCSGPKPSDCVACRHAVLGGDCINHCPSGTYLYLRRRCVTKMECWTMPSPLDQYESDLHWKPYNLSCTLKCPPGFEEVREGNMYSCRECKGKCQLECPGSNVDSISAAQKLRGCTYIKGALEIQIGGGKNVIKELEENLNSIEEVEDYVKVSRSFPLVSLNFLKSLRVIHGKKPERDQYALVVYENQNLQELWNWTGRAHKLEIRGNRKFFFHFNSKLCYQNIEQLRIDTGLPSFEDVDVAPNSNGDKVACELERLNLRVAQKAPKAVILHWDNFRKKLADRRSLLGYIVSYIEAPFQNISLYDGRDACGGDGWKVDDVAANDDINSSSSGQDVEYEAHIITQLKPATQYAVYVKTYTIETGSGGKGAESNITYFMTHPDTPSPPVGLEGHSRNPSEVSIEWHPPQYPNGNVTYYRIYLHEERDDKDFLDQRDYCREPPTPSDHTKRKPGEEWADQSTLKGGRPGVGMDGEDCCTCPKDKKQLELEEQEIQFQIHFEDFLHNQVYIKRQDTSDKGRQRRSLPVGGLPVGNGEMNMLQQSGGNFTLHTTRATSPATTNPTYNIQNSPPQEMFTQLHQIVNTTRLTLRNLSHFTEYTIAVEACRETHPEIRSDQKVCSTKSIVTLRTLPLAGADAVDSGQVKVEVSNHTAGRVRLRWEGVYRPNGLIVAYHIEYKRADIESVKPTVECVTRKHFETRGKAHEIGNLAPGNYSIRLAATSLAGIGNYTVPRYVLIREPSGGMAVETIVAIVAGIFLVLVTMAVAGTFYYRKKFAQTIPNGILFASVNPEYVSAGDAYVPDGWEVDREKINLMRELGQGSFGMVYEGLANDLEEESGRIKCAVKTVNEHASNRDRLEFLNEASVMKAFNCHHVVKLLGVVSKGQPTLVVMELMANGDLKSYLRSHRPDCPAENPSDQQPPSLKRILQMAAEIADGMAYLAAKKFVHRDLAARNCMVAEDLTVKIGDFGMTRDIYETDYYRKGSKGLLPVRWMSPESLKDGVFTSQSDVWSYGVVLWEMATLASQPYQGLSNEQVLRYVIDGGIMERPENCPEKLYELMTVCWQHSPHHRPRFLDLVALLLTDVSGGFEQVSFYHGDEARELREMKDTHLHREKPTLGDGDDNASDSSDDDDDDDPSPTTPLHTGISFYPHTSNQSGSESDIENEEELEIEPVLKEVCCGGDGSVGNAVKRDDSGGLATVNSASSEGSKASGRSAANGFIGHRAPIIKTTEC